MRRPSWLFWILIGGLVLAGISLIARHESGEVFGLASSDFARMTMLLAVLIAVSASVLSRGALGRATRSSLVWVGIGLVLVGGYTYRNELEWVARRTFGQLVPGSLMVQRDEAGIAQAVVVARGFAGQFTLRAEINQAAVDMLVDTGASIVTLSFEDAIKAGITPADLNFRIPVLTANGPTEAAPVVLDRLTVGPIDEQRLPALVAQPGALDKSLLGMNFLDRLSGFSVSRDQLTLTP